MVLRKCRNAVTVTIMSIQIALGLIWIFMNIGMLQNFGESLEYVAAAQSGVWNEYQGILYVLFVKLACGLGEITGVHYFVYIQIFQVLLGLFTCWIFINTLLGDKLQSNTVSGHWIVRNWKLLLVVLFINSIPMISQCHLSVLPYSLTLSVAFCFLSFLVKRNWIGLASMLIIVSMLQPDNIFLFGIPFFLVGIVAGIRGWKQCGRQRKILVVSLMVMALFIQWSLLPGRSWNLSVTKQNETKRIQNSFSASMLERFAWPYFGTSYFFWPEETKAVLSEQDGEDASYRFDSVRYSVGPMLEKAYGRQGAANLYRKMAKISLQTNTKEIVMNILSDGISYLVMPLTIGFNGQGIGIAKTGWNISRLWEHTPFLSKYYLGWSLAGFTLLLIITLMAKCLEWLLHKDQQLNKKMKILSIMSMVAIIWPAAWYTLRSHELVDYKYMLVGMAFWYLLCSVPALTMGEGNTENEDK